MKAIVKPLGSDWPASSLSVEYKAVHNDFISHYSATDTKREDGSKKLFAWGLVL